MSAEKFTRGEWVLSGNYIESNGVSICAFGDTWVTFENFNANAHLISAAPDMYRALQKVMSYQGEHMEDWLRDECDAALAKADGEV